MSKTDQIPSLGSWHFWGLRSLPSKGACCPSLQSILLEVRTASFLAQIQQVNIKSLSKLREKKKEPTQRTLVMNAQREAGPLYRSTRTKPRRMGRLGSWANLGMDTTPYKCHTEAPVTFILHHFEKQTDP